MTDSAAYTKARELVVKFYNDPEMLRKHIHEALLKASNDTFVKWKNSCAMNGFCYLASEIDNQ